MLGVWGVLLVNFVDPEEAIGSIVAIKGIPFVVLGVKVRSESIFWGDLVIWEPASEMGWQALPKVARLTWCLLVVIWGVFGGEVVWVWPVLN